MISLRGFSVAYGDRIALAPLDLDLAPGEAVGLAGASGCGKSTLLRALAGALPEQAHLAGELSVEGGVGYVPQNPAHALFCAGVEEEVAAGPRHRGLDDPPGRAARALHAIGAEGLMARSCRTLSSGESQRVAIAGALACDPVILLLDEPTSYLDDVSLELLDESLTQLRAAGKTLLIAEHRFDRLATPLDRIVSLGPNLPFALPALPPPITPGVVVLAAEGLEFRAGERLALVGSNGAGKTTLARRLAGLSGRNGVRPGIDVGLAPPDPTDALLCESVAEEIAFGPRNLDRICLVSEVLTSVGLSGREDARPTSLSLGGQVRLSVAALLGVTPPVLILDEPTIGQDAASLGRLLTALAELAARGTAVLIVTHDEAVARAFATRIFRIEAGRLSP